MRKIYPLFIALLLFGFPSFGQTYSTKLETKTIISQRLISLNGGLRASVGGKSRTTVPINLPKGTIFWFYSFTTSPAGSGTKNLQLLLQLTSTIADPGGLANFATSKIKVPSGSGTIDVFLLDQNNIGVFQNKEPFRYIPSGSVTATKQGKVKVNYVNKNLLYLGIRNPSSLNGIDITLEVVAIIAKKTYHDDWSSEHLNQIYNSCLQTLQIKGLKAKQICNCLVKRIKDSLRPSEFSKLSTFDMNLLIKKEKTICAKKTGNLSLIGRKKRVEKLYELLRGENAMKDYAAQEKTILELIKNDVNTWIVYNNLGFTRLCLKDYEGAKKAIETGLGKNPNAILLEENLANYYLLTGKYNQAIEIYKKYRKDRLPTSNQKFKDVVAEDLKEFERLGLGNANFDRVKKELRIKRK